MTAETDDFHDAPGPGTKNLNDSADRSEDDLSIRGKPAAEPPREDRHEEPEQLKGQLPGFSVAASKLFYVQLNKYLVDLERFSRFKAKQDNVDGVSAGHVRAAAGFLSESRITSRFSRWCETIGGIVLGGGISELIVLLQDQKYSGLLVLVTAILIAGGAAMIGIFLGRD